MSLHDVTTVYMHQLLLSIRVYIPQFNFIKLASYMQNHVHAVTIHCHNTLQKLSMEYDERKSVV